MDESFRTDAQIDPALKHGYGCRCALHSRRLFTAGVVGSVVAVPAVAREGVDVGGESAFAKLVPAEQIEAASRQQYQQLLQQAARQRALAPESHPQEQRLREIARRIIPFTYAWNPRAREWQWEVNLIGSKDLNAFCMPGGKIAFFYGLLSKLQLTDDEVAMIMGHEMTHALREHARERMGKNYATRMGAGIVSSILGLGGAGNTLLNMGSQLLTLKFSRDDETEADLIGMELGARAGYDPRAGVSLWQKMLAANRNAPPQFLSTHPAGPTRIRDIESNLPKVEPIYAKSTKPERKFGPPPPARSG
ncbi:MAG TPA: M48 family metallopeptidase [Burkholderiaceae bacterium]|nr:M48 family metallopeptidase [Burkholderiaceae bacterium]